MRVDIVTIFPEYFAPLDLSLIGKARATGGLLDVAVHDLRSWTHDVHRTVDDTPYGGGPGMVMRPEPWGAGAGRAVRRRRRGSSCRRRPGAPFTQATGARAGRRGAPGLRLRPVRGHRPAGARPRGRPGCRSREVSLGDYVLFGGEVAVLVILEAVTRLLPGVLGNADSLAEESHAARAAGGAGLHQAAAVARARRAGGAALRRPRPDRPVAARPRRCCAPRTGGPTCSPRAGRDPLDKA